MPGPGIEPRTMVCEANDLTTKLPQISSVKIHIISAPLATAETNPDVRVLHRTRNGNEHCASWRQHTNKDVCFRRF